MGDPREYWIRFTAASVIIIATVAAATAIAGLEFFDDVAERIEPIPEAPAFEAAGNGIELPEPEPGEPYTLLLLGSDRRPTLPDERSDTTMLMRLDPERDLISLLSFPRDMEVYIPGYGYDRLNAAYSEGGPLLTAEVLEDLTDIEVNEVVDVDFKGFADAVDAVNCVYVDVDREYFNPPGTGFAEIDINAGYQRLCGLKALQFVRFRHTDNDIVRAARQQMFLREARQRIDVSDLLFSGTGADLIDAFVDNTQSTIKDGSTLRQIAKSLVDLRNASVRQITIEGDLGPELIEVGSAEIEDAVDRFLGLREFEEPEDVEEQGTSLGDPGSSDPDELDEASDRREQRREERRRRQERKQLELVEADPQFARYAGTAKRRLKIDAFYPTRLPPGSAFDRDSRTYEFDGEDGQRESAYKLVVNRPHPRITTEYFGFTGTTWDDPPILRSPSETRTSGGRAYLLFYAGDDLRTVGWRENGASYWISNSLLLTLSEAEMLEIAESMAGV